MRLSPLILAPALATAFLVPSNLDAAVESLNHAWENVASKLDSVKIGVNPFKQVVELDCPGCAYKISDQDGMKLYTHAKNSLRLEFTSSGSPETPHDLKVNGHDIFRLTKSAITPIQATQVLAGAQHSEPFDSTVTVSLGFEFFIQRIARGVRNVRLHIVSVDGMRTTRNMPIVDMTVLSDEQGVMYISKAEARLPTPNEASAAECRSNLICRWKAYFADKIHSLAGGRKGGCHGKRPGNGTHSVPPHRGGDHGSPPSHSHGNSTYHHGSGQHHGHHHRGFWLHTVIKYAIVPIVLGTLAGFVVSFIGLFVGHLAIAVYRLATGKPVCARRCAKKATGGAEEEGLLKEDVTDEEEEEELPAYADAVLVEDEKIEQL